MSQPPCGGYLIFDRLNRLTSVTGRGQMGICHYCHQEVLFELNNAGNHFPGLHFPSERKNRGGYRRRR